MHNLRCRGYVRNLRFILSGEVEQEGNDQEWNDGVCHLHWDVVLSLLWELIVLFAMEEDRPHNQDEGEYTYNDYREHDELPERDRSLVYR